ncbi:hypothetical protein ACIBEK_09385 [Nocardia fusca]|uniref:hypothetical protein n=1 Tax=Nocardia fusca TaxID=941183 RepID=UPI0037A38B0E
MRTTPPELIERYERAGFQLPNWREAAATFDAGAVPPRLENLRAHFPEAAVAERKWPVQIHIVTDFARTAGGKVQKFLVRRRLRDKRTRRAIPQS